MTNSDHDIFGAYDCLINDKVQARFVSVIANIREIILAQANAQSININPFPSAKLYLAAICSLLNSRLEQKNHDGLPELLRCLNIALESSTIDTSIAGSLLGYLSPLLVGAYDDLAIPMCPVCVQLAHHTTVNSETMDVLIQFLCEKSLSDEPRLRNSAAQAIYDFPEIHTIVFDLMFEKSNNNRNVSLRALHVAKNLSTAIQGNCLTKQFELALKLGQDTTLNRGARVKAIQIIAVALHYMSPDVVLSTVKLFTKDSEVPGDILYAKIELLQSAITMLVHFQDKSIFAREFPSILQELFHFLTLNDKEATPLINSIVLYGINAIVSVTSNPAAIHQVVDVLGSYLSITYISIWAHVYKILETLPALLKANTLDYLGESVKSSLGKMANADATNIEMITSFVANCANEVGLRSFFDRVELLVLQEGGQLDFETQVLPVLSAYAGKCTSDLFYTDEKILPALEMYHQQLEDSHSKMLWHRIWNVVPNCVHTCAKEIEAETQRFDTFVNFCCDSIETYPDLCRIVCKIFQVVGPFLDDDLSSRVLLILSNKAVDASSSSMVIPALSIVARAKSSEFVNNFFENTMTQKILPLASDPSSISIACALIDIVIALIGQLSDSNLNNLYDVLISFIQHKSHLQKKALRTLRILLNKKRTDQIIGATAQLIQILNSSKDSISSSTVRYRLLLMSTLLQLKDNEFHGQMLLSFLPEFVAALKDTGAKTREAGTECIFEVANELVKMKQPLGPVLSAIAIGLTANVSTIVSASIEAVDLIVGRYSENITPEEIKEISSLIWKAAYAETGTEITRSAISFALTLIRRMHKFVESMELDEILKLGVHCIKKTNWEIKGKGRKLVFSCFDLFEGKTHDGKNKAHNNTSGNNYNNNNSDLFREKFPQGEEKLFRGLRKEYNRTQRDKEEEAEKNKEAKKEESKIVLDGRYDVDAISLNDPKQTVSHIDTPEKIEEEDLEFDQRGRLVLKEAPKKKTRADKEEEKEDEDEDHGNEVAQHIRQKKQILKQNMKQREQFVTETGNRFRAPKGKGDRQKDGQTPYSFAPLTSKVVNKRFKGQMKAAYKKQFKSKQ